MQGHRGNWLDVFAGFRIAFSLKKMGLGALMVFSLALIAWGLLVLGRNWWPASSDHLAALWQDPIRAMPPFLGALSEGVRDLAANGFRYPQGGVAWRPLAFAAGSTILFLVVTAFFGGAICRLAAVEFARDEHLSLNEGLLFARSKFGSFFWAPLVPFVAAVVFLLLASVVGVVGRIPWVGPPLMGLLTVLQVPTFFTFLAALVLLCGVFGFVFSWPTIAVEGTNAFDAVSRSFNYLLARPWQTAWCWLAATVYGAACLAFAAGFTWVFWKLALLCMSFGMGPAQFKPILPFVSSWTILPETPFPTVLTMILVKIAQVFLLGFLAGLLVSLKCTLATLIYFVIRRAVDGTEMDVVFLPEPGTDLTEGEASGDAPAAPTPTEAPKP